MISLTSALSNRFKQKIISATVIDVIGRKCAVRLSGNGTKLTNLDYIGSKPSVGDNVLLDYRNANIPSVLATTNPTPPAATAQNVCTLPDGTPTYPTDGFIPYDFNYNSPVPPATNSLPVVNYRTYSWTLGNPVPGGIPGGRLFDGQVPVRVDGYCIGGVSVLVNIEVRPTIGTTGTSLMGSDLPLPPSGASSESFATTIVPANNWLWLNISAVNGVPTAVVVTLTTRLAG